MKTRLATIIETDKFADEILVEVKKLVIQFVGLPQGKIAKIFLTKFRPINLYWLCLMRSHNNLH